MTTQNGYKIDIQNQTSNVHFVLTNLTSKCHQKSSALIECEKAPGKDKTTMHDVKKSPAKS